MSRRRARCLLAALLAVAALLTPRRVATAQDWIDGRAQGPFVYRSTFRLADEQPLLDELAALEDDLVATLGIRPAGEQVELYLFGDDDGYRRYVSARFPEVPYRRALFVKAGGPGTVYAYRSRRFDIDLRHETTHALLHASLAGVPLWLDEGLAEYFEMPRDARAGGHPYLASMPWSIRLGIVPRLEALEAKRDLAEMGRNEYRHAWAWVHFMLHGPPEAGAELRSYLAELAAGVAAEPLSRRLARRVPDMERRFVEHFRAWSP
jgi:hypothetical protein